MSSDLPAMLTREQAAAWLQVSLRALDGMLNRGELPSVKLGSGRTSPVRIPRDEMLKDLGLLSAADDRKRKRAAEAERHAAEAMR